MLSLKNSTINFSRSRKHFVDLPQEVLDFIAEHLYAACGHMKSAVIPLSITCHRLRASTLPMIFETIVLIAASNGLLNKSLAALWQLFARADLSCHVRHLYLLSPSNDDGSRAADPAAHYVRSRELLGQIGKHMTGLKYVRLDKFSSLGVQLLQSLVDNASLHVTFDMAGMRGNALDPVSLEQCQSVAAKCQWSFDISFPDSKDFSTRTRLMEFVVANPRMIGLSSSRYIRLFERLATGEVALGQLQELYISFSVTRQLQHLRTTYQAIWPNLKKLQIEGDKQIIYIIPYFVSHLQNLTHLRLQPYDMKTFHGGCRADASPTATTDKLPWTQLANLRHLELFSVCKHLSITQLTTPHLKSLRIQTPDYAFRNNGHDFSYSLSDITWLAGNAPHLERLELHIGPLENLWNPTAVPGVDVNVEVYQFLHALTLFPRLRQLRLFPHYIPRTAQQSSTDPRQPLSDEQAVRIFRHLKTQRPSLDTVYIAATVDSLGTFHPMSWMVRSAGEKTLLTTRQASKDYEIEQIWIGERRESMSNRRYTYSRPYLPDLGDWTYSFTR